MATHKRGLPVSDETRAQAIELMRAGELGRNAIARETGLSTASVTNIAQEIGHTFDRSKSELAVAARTVDLAKMRVELAHAFALEAWQSMEDMHSPALLVQFEAGRNVNEYEDGKLVRTRTKPGKFRSTVLPEPSFSDKRNLMTIAGIAVTKIAELTKSTAAEGSADAVSYLDNLGAALSVASEALRSRDAESDPTVEPENQSRESFLEELEAEAQQSAETDPSGATD